MEDYSDSDASSESEYNSSQGSEAGSNCSDECLEPELSQTTEEFENAPWDPQAQLDAIRLAQLHKDIKDSAQLPVPSYSKLSRNWPARPFDVRTLPEYVC